MVLGVFRVFFCSVFVFTFRLLRNFLAFPSVAGGVAMAFVDDLFLPPKARSSFIFLRTLPASLPCRSEVWDWLLRSRIFDSCSSSWIGVSINFP